MNTIKQLRERTGLSQEKFAEKFHISIRTLQRWEQGQNPVNEHTLYMISRILELEQTQQMISDMLEHKEE